MHVCMWQGPFLLLMTFGLVCFGFCLRPWCSVDCSFQVDIGVMSKVKEFKCLVFTIEGKKRLIGGLVLHQFIDANRISEWSLLSYHGLVIL